MSFKYELIVNGIVKRSISKCWTTLLYIEVLKDIIKLQELGNKKEFKYISWKITREV